MIKTALALTAFETDGDGLLQETARSDLRPEQVTGFLLIAPDDDPDLDGAEYDVRPSAVPDICALFGVQPVDGTYFVSSRSVD